MRPSFPASAMALALAISSPASGQETRIAPEGHEPPPAEIEQMDWLVGQWDGSGIGDNRAMESWLPPSEGTMVGTFVQTADSGGIQFTEHLYLMEEDGSLVLRLKHFNDDLTGWEERDEMLTFRLVAMEECAAFFHALTLRCDGEDGLVAAVRMGSEGDEVSELVFRLRRTDSSSTAPVCADAATTLDLNECYAEVLERADERRARYLHAAVERISNQPEVAARISAADAAFNDYRDAECGAVYDYWISGSIRNVMTLTCRIAMTDQRTRRIWSNWLTYMDSTPSILPEPEPTR